jgi:hypothetical protein
VKLSTLFMWWAVHILQTRPYISDRVRWDNGFDRPVGLRWDNGCDRPVGLRWDNGCDRPVGLRWDNGFDRPVHQ